MAHTLLPTDQYNSTTHTSHTSSVSSFLSSLLFVFPFIVSLSAAVIILG